MRNELRKCFSCINQTLNIGPPPLFLHTMGINNTSTTVPIKNKRSYELYPMIPLIDSRGMPSECTVYQLCNHSHHSVFVMVGYAIITFHLFYLVVGIHRLYAEALASKEIITHTRLPSHVFLHLHSMNHI